VPVAWLRRSGRGHAGFASELAWPSKLGQRIGSLKMEQRRTRTDLLLVREREDRVREPAFEGRVIAELLEQRHGRHLPRGGGVIMRGAHLRLAPRLLLGGQELEGSEARVF
jgi:hypothetical protein